LQQVFVNLFENAAKYTPEGSPLEVKAQRHNAEIEITVADRGGGIAAGDEERIFEKFFRGTHVGIGGVGLGLPICRGIIEAHGGTLTARNRSGGGTLFRIGLPIVAGAPLVEPESDA
jgi:two-component system sensor histidine kinase KdpD